MAVVAADVVLLGLLAVQQAAGLHEELLDVDIRRQAVPAQVGEEIQFGVVTEYPFDKGFEETPLQTVAQGWAAEAQGRVDRQPTLRQLPDALVERVDKPIGFAQAQRAGHVNMHRQPRQHLVDRTFDRTALHHRSLLAFP